MFFSLFYAIPPGVTTWNLSEKGVIAKMTYLAEFWLILESDLVERARTEYLLNGSENVTHNTKDCTLTNTFGLTKFGYVMKKL
jgi:hypothetical protein